MLSRIVELAEGDIPAAAEFLAKTAAEARRNRGLVKAAEGEGIGAQVSDFLRNSQYMPQNWDLSSAYHAAEPYLPKDPHTLDMLKRTAIGAGVGGAATGAMGLMQGRRGRRLANSVGPGALIGALGYGMGPELLQVGKDIAGPTHPPEDTAKNYMGRSPADRAFHEMILRDAVPEGAKATGMGDLLGQGVGQATAPSALLGAAAGAAGHGHVYARARNDALVKGLDSIVQRESVKGGNPEILKALESFRMNVNGRPYGGALDYLRHSKGTAGPSWGPVTSITSRANDAKYQSLLRNAMSDGWRARDEKALASTGLRALTRRMAGGGVVGRGLGWLRGLL